MFVLVLFIVALCCANNIVVVEPFQISKAIRTNNNNSRRQEDNAASTGKLQHIIKDNRVFVSSSDDQKALIVGDDDDDGNPEKSRNTDQALSSLIGDMFQARLEMSQEMKEIEALQAASSQQQNESNGNNVIDMPVLGNDGIYRILNEDQFHNFQAEHSDKLVFMKFSSPICQACRMLKQKFQQLHRSQDPRFIIAPVVFADIVMSNNKKVRDPFRDYVTSQLQVKRIPSIYFYVNGGDTPVDKFCCDLDTGGCSWPTIQQQMLQSIDQWTTKVTGDDGITQHYEVLRKATTTTTTTTLHKDNDDGNVEKAAIKDDNVVLISPTTNIAASAGTATMNTTITTTTSSTVTKEKSKKAPKSFRKRIRNLLSRKITQHNDTDDDDNNKVG